MIHTVTLETPRLILRELHAEDASAIQEYAADVEVVRHLDWGPNTPKDTEQFLAIASAARAAVPRTAYHLATGRSRRSARCRGAAVALSRAPRARTARPAQALYTAAL